MEGRIQTRSYEKNGEKRYATDIVANNIILTGDTEQVFNGVCGAESGQVPVAAAAPSPGGRPPQGTPVPGSFTILMVGRAR